MDSTKQSLHLPQDIIEEILSELPVKSVLRFRCVSKSWRCSIGNERFIEAHARKSAQNSTLARHRVIFCAESHVIKQCTLLSLLNNGPSIDLTPFDDPTNNQNKGYIVIGCCNGLLCIHDCSTNSFILRNPTIGISTKLPKLGNINIRIKKAGFGWDEQSGAHKVFVVMSQHGETIGKVYSTKTNSWETVATGNINPRWLRGKFLGGKLYWYDYYRSCIESFDLASEKFGRIKLPYIPKGRFYASLGDIRGCLCIVFNEPFEVWVMKESWSKLATIPIPHCRLSRLGRYPSAGGGPNGEIYISLGHTLLIYNPKDDVLSGPRNIEGLAMCVESHVYVESLFSLALVESS